MNHFLHHSPLPGARIAWVGSPASDRHPAPQSNSLERVQVYM
jgi:hypothetical protein